MTLLLYIWPKNYKVYSVLEKFEPFFPLTESSLEMCWLYFYLLYMYCFFVVFFCFLLMGRIQFIIDKEYSVSLRSEGLTSAH